MSQRSLLEIPPDLLRVSLLHTLSLDYRTRIALSIPCDWLPKDLHILLPRPATASAQGTLQMVKGFEVGRDPGLSPQGPCERWPGGMTTEAGSGGRWSRAKEGCCERGLGSFSPRVFGECVPAESWTPACGTSSDLWSPERRSGCREWWEAGSIGEGGGRWRKVAYPHFGAGVIGTWGEREDRQ